MFWMCVHVSEVFDDAVMPSLRSIRRIYSADSLLISLAGNQPIHSILKEGTLNWEILQFKSKFPREVLLCRVGDFYEAIGIDACILVEYAGLNPFGGLRSDSIPRAGCPVVTKTFFDICTHGMEMHYLIMHLGNVLWPQLVAEKSI
ncbi:hypothetical protein CsSME_00033843 [Camellia sinensis var. sinensis]